MSVVPMSLRTISSHNMMPAAEGMTHMIPNHVLRVGQTTRLDPTPETNGRHDDCDDRDLDISLENLNRIILELDPTFEPLHLGKGGPSTSPAPGRARQAKASVGTLSCLYDIVLSQVFVTQKEATQTVAATVVQRYDVHRRKTALPPYETDS